MTRDTEMHVAYAADDRYAKFLGISMLSLFAQNAGFTKIRVYILDCGIGEENHARLSGIAETYGRELIWFAMENIEKKLNLQGAAFKISVASYARLFLASLLPEDVDKLLYLDCDTIVADSLTALWRTPLGDALIAGVQDTVDAYFQKVIGLAAELPYVNAGILLINLKAWRAEGLQEQFDAFIQRFQGQVPHHDQGTINGVCGKRRLLLPVRYNMTSNLYSFSAHTIERIYFLRQYYTQKELDAALRSPAIVHFTSGLVGRPWEEGCTHPEKERFLQAVAQTPWKDDALTPNTMKKSTRAFTFFYEHVPNWLFIGVYRALGWVQHLRR